MYYQRFNWSYFLCSSILCPISSKRHHTFSLICARKTSKKSKLKILRNSTIYFSWNLNAKCRIWVDTKNNKKRILFRIFSNIISNLSRKGCFEVEKSFKQLAYGYLFHAISVPLRCHEHICTFQSIRCKAHCIF